jgi:hypothetical protein
VAPHPGNVFTPSEDVEGVPQPTTSGV